MKFTCIFSILALASPFMAKSTSDSDESLSTLFNGQEVPPMLNIAGSDLTDTISKGNW
jgi:hypothetical protein